MTPKDCDRPGDGTSDLGDHRELKPGMCEFSDRRSGIPGGNTSKLFEDPLSGLLTGG